MPEISQAEIEAQADAILAGDTRFNTIRRDATTGAGNTFNYDTFNTYDVAYNDNAAIAGGRDAVIGRVTAVYSNQGYTVTPAEPAAPATPPPNPFANDDALAFLQNTLDQYGLGSLAEWAFGMLQQGRSADYILLELRKRLEFRERFPAIFERQQRGLAPISPAEYIEYEQQARQVMRQFGLPQGFYDQRQDFTRFISEDVSLAELYERVRDGYSQVMAAPQAVRDAFADFFGPQGDAALAAFFLDTERATPILRNLVTEAAIGGAARLHGIQASHEASRMLRERGITESEAQAGFAEIRAMDPLFAETVAEGANAEDFTAEREGIGAAFGVNADATRALERRQRQRAAAFAGGGGAVLGQTGVAGLGIEESTL